MKKVMIICMVLVFVVGCEESLKNEIPNPTSQKPNIKSLDRQLIQIRDPNWIIDYGDGIESQITYNLIILRNNQLLIADMINKMHPNDPNNPNNLKVRVEKLEEIANYNPCERIVEMCPKCEPDAITFNLIGSGCPNGYDVIFVDKFCDKHKHLDPNVPTLESSKNIIKEEILICPEHYEWGCEKCKSIYHKGGFIIPEKGSYYYNKAIAKRKSTNPIEGQIRQIPKTWRKKGYLELYNGKEWKTVSE